jgi:hypothetical protein
MRALWFTLSLASAAILVTYSFTSTPLNGGWLIAAVTMSVATYNLITRKANK